MKITWLGQAGLLFEKNGKTVMIDPYLSNSVVKVNPLNFRRVPVEEKFFDMTPDVMIFTHDHLDHYDPETAPRFFAKTDKQMLVLCPASVWQKARTHGGGHNYVQFDRLTEWTAYGMRFSAVHAEHSDPHAIGAIIEDLDTGKTYYVTGDTLYNKRIFADLPSDIDVIFLPVNGIGNNMNEVDAVRFFKASGAKVAVPLHVGMFDEKTPDLFKAEPRVLPEIYKEIKL
ncbi:MAG: MBL fold metallo-hydrolase [Ruminococcaceae bacterium]|nr:MBL fold metallo-hydrolase [Oscillospiraceae bacterium]